MSGLCALAQMIEVAFAIGVAKLVIVLIHAPTKSAARSAPLADRKLGIVWER